MLIFERIDEWAKVRGYDGNQGKHETMDHRVSSGTGW